MRSMEFFGPGFTPQQLDQLKALEVQVRRSQPQALDTKVLISG